MTLSSLTILWLFGASLLPGCDASNNSACARLASTLSAAYQSDQHFLPSDQPLESYLDHNGVLLTMCMRYGGMIPWMECSRKDGDTKLSASWVHTNQTRGWRVIGKPVDKGPPVGLALKPTETTIRCLYPVDGVTDARDGNGCGPLSSDARYGSQGYDHLKWYKKMLLKENIMHYKTAVFGSNVTWDSIPCSDFFQMPPDTDTAEIPLLSRLNDSNKTGFVYLTQANMQIDKWSYIMGFPVCNQSMPPPAPTFQKQILLYMGKTWWKSEDWNSIIKLMDNALDSHPSLNIWNEVCAITLWILFEISALVAIILL